MNALMPTKKQIFSGIFTGIAIAGISLSLTGCGKKKNATPVAQGPVYPQYPQPGYSPYPGMPVGPVSFPAGGYCANSIPNPRGSAILAQNLSDVIVDGEGGCLRLIEVQQFNEATSNGMAVSSSATDTSVDYDFVRSGRGRRTRYGTRARVQTRNLCQNSRATGTDTSISLPLWIDRDTGSIGQNLRLQGGNRWSIANNGQGYDLDAFVRLSSASGVQGMQAHHTADGDLEIFVSRMDYTGASGVVGRVLTRAVYRADY